jgi:hypothetical protein
MNQKRLRKAVAAADVFEAASAFLGAVGLVVGFIGIPVTILSGTPFADFTVPALLLGFGLAAVPWRAPSPQRLGFVRSTLWRLWPLASLRLAG